MSEQPSTEAGCYVMGGVIYTSHPDGSETSRKATPEEVLLSNALQALHDQQSPPEPASAPATDRMAQLHDMLHTDQTGLAAGLENVLRTVAGFRWVTEGRGCYEWDDERYRDEMRSMLDQVQAAARAAVDHWKAGDIPRPCCVLCEQPPKPSAKRPTVDKEPTP